MYRRSRGLILLARNRVLSGETDVGQGSNASSLIVFFFSKLI